jgi:hypothetical protein
MTSYLNNIVKLDQITSRQLGSFVFFERTAAGFSDMFSNLGPSLQVGWDRGLPVFVYWPITEFCNDHYLNLFEPIQGVTFVDEEAAIYLREHPGRFTKIEVKRNLARRQQLTVLKPKRRIIKSVREFVTSNGLSNAMGFHIRKTDLVNKATKRDFILNYGRFDEMAVSHQNPIFLATDDQNVRVEYISKYGERIFTYDFEFHSAKFGGCRQTSLESSIIDLYILAHCRYFVGTENQFGVLSSAFSILAFHLHKLHQKNQMPGFTNVETFLELFKEKVWAIRNVVMPK